MDKNKKINIKLNVLCSTTKDVPINYKYSKLDHTFSLLLLHIRFSSIANTYLGTAS